MGRQHRRHNLIIGLFAGAAVLSQLDRQAIAILKPLLVADLNWSDGDYATVVAWYQVASACALLFTGWIIDRVRLRSTISVAVIGWSMAMVAQGLMRTLVQACAFRVGLGMFQALGLPGSVRALGELLPPSQRATAFGISNACVTIGAIIAPILLPTVALYGGWRGSFIGLGVIGFGWTLAWLGWFRDPLLQPPRPIDHAAQDVHRRARTIIFDPRYQQIAIAKTLSDMTWWLMLFWMPDFFHRQFGLAATEAGGPIALAYLLCAAGALVFGTAITRMIARGSTHRRSQMTALSFAFVCVLSFTAVASAGNPWTAALLLGVGLFGHQGFSTSIFAIISGEARPGEVGRLIGFCAFCGNVAGALVVKVAGSLLMAGVPLPEIFLYMPIAYAFSWLTFHRLFAQVNAKQFAAV